ncbi:hypothetical protein AWC38_SpisGene19112 [Stylophora pistillata]|uniref:Uncharacterized protein n=1 Tax=Stylophora pistillata TaxID=50429 RepID=A0A2B4RG62_STYPI|nr:hypothetical protein AWC38_SpisGene19112 [Stylophora pistillata]
MLKSKLSLQFWILYYRSFQKAVTCGSATEPMDTANIREIQTIYCYGLDLEIPLLFSLSPCSSSLKDKVVQCTREFSNLFKFNILSNTMCRVRAKAKVCVAMAWQVSCAPSDVVKALDDDEELSGGLIGFIVCIAVIVCIIGLITCYLKFRRCIEDLPDRAEVP